MPDENMPENVPAMPHLDNPELQAVINKLITKRNEADYRSYLQLKEVVGILSEREDDLDEDEAATLFEAREVLNHREKVNDWFLRTVATGEVPFDAQEAIDDES